MFKLKSTSSIKNQLLLFLFLVCSNSYAQNVTFKEIKLKPQTQFYNVNELTIIYPVIVTGDSGVEKKMNDNVRAEMFYSDNDTITTIDLLNERISNGLINLSYEVTLKKNGILSMYIYAEGCGAYCSSSNTYFNFDLKTGNALSITDLFLGSKIDDFRKMVFADKVKALTAYKSEEKEFLKTNDMDSTTVNWALEQVDESCISKIEIEHFSLSDFGIEIIDPCEFPHAIRSQQPIYELKYSYKIISSFLKPIFMARLQK